MLKRSVCWGVGLLLTAGSGLAAAQTAPAQTVPPQAAPAQAVPAQPAPGTPLGKEMRGQIVRVDPQTGMVVIRQGTGANAKDMMYRVGKTTKYYGTGNKTLSDGLRYNGYKRGTDVWYRYVPANGTGTGTGTGTTVPMNLNELRLGPSVITPGGTGTTPGGATRPAGTTPGGSGR